VNTRTNVIEDENGQFYMNGTLADLRKNISKEYFPKYSLLELNGSKYHCYPEKVTTHHGQTVFNGTCTEFIQSRNTTSLITTVYFNGTSYEFEFHYNGKVYYNGKAIGSDGYESVEKWIRENVIPDYYVVKVDNYGTFRFYNSTKDSYVTGADGKEVICRGPLSCLTDLLQEKHSFVHVHDLSSSHSYYVFTNGTVVHASTGRPVHENVTDVASLKAWITENQQFTGYDGFEHHYTLYKNGTLYVDGELVEDKNISSEEELFEYAEEKGDVNAYTCYIPARDYYLKGTRPEPDVYKMGLHNHTVIEKLPQFRGRTTSSKVWSYCMKEKPEQRIQIHVPGQGIVSYFMFSNQVVAEDGTVMIEDINTIKKEGESDIDAIKRIFEKNYYPKSYESPQLEGTFLLYADGKVKFRNTDLEDTWIPYEGVEGIKRYIQEELQARQQSVNLSGIVIQEITVDVSSVKSEEVEPTIIPSLNTTNVTIDSTPIVPIVIDPLTNKTEAHNTTVNITDLPLVIKNETNVDPEDIIGKLNFTEVKPLENATEIDLKND